MIVVPDSHHFADKEQISLKELKDEDFIFIEVGYGNDIDRMFLDARFTPSVKYRMVDDISVLSMVENNFGISILPKLTTLRTTYHVRMIDMLPSYSRHLGIVTNRNAYLSWAAKTFRQFALRF